MEELPHVVMFPLPLQGPIKVMVKLAELLCAAGIRVTFINTEHSQHRLFRHSDKEGSLPTRHSNLDYHALPDGLPEEHPRSGESITELFISLRDVCMLHFREFLKKTRPNACIVSDGIFAFGMDYAEELNIPLIYFVTISPSCLWIYLCLRNLAAAGEIPCSEYDLDGEVKGVPGMEGILRRRDLPGFCRTAGVNDDIVKMVIDEADILPRARALLLNTFLDIEPREVVSNLRMICPTLYAVGPLHGLCRTRKTTSFSSSLWEEDRSCISWLDDQPAKSVVYVSIGSQAVMTADEVVEIWRGLADSGYRFLWVQREGFLSGGGNISAPPALAAVTKQRGFVVKWAPQEEVLRHVAVGGFLTHGGWNSTLESIEAGVPMICWPYFVDQQVNSRLVEKVWGLGLDMKDTCRHDVVENMVRYLMGTRREEFAESASEVAATARRSVYVGGSSWCDLDRLIEDLRMLKASSLVAN